ncbi:MAG: hypothetical protein ABL977_12705 [Candidatus Eisenbacteria bacterium]
MQQSIVRTLFAALALGTLAAPLFAAEQVEQVEKRRTIRVSYGTVVDLQEEKTASNMASGAVLGGAIGAAVSHHKKTGDQLKNAAAGALIGALLTRATEGSHRTWGVTVKRTDGSTIKVIQDHVDGLAPGGCVSLEEGTYTNVRAVSPLLCGDSSHGADSVVSLAMQQSADLCHAAKEALAQAKTKDEFDLAMKKIQILCH